MKSIEVDGTRLAYAESGSPTGDRPTLLLVHGFPLSHAMWREQLSGLADACHVVAPDLRGYGETPLGGWPAEDAAPSLARYADDLVALIEAIDSEGPVVLAGFSMGGYTSFELLRRRPDCVDAVALIDTKALADTEEARATRLKMADGVATWGAARVAELMRPNLFAPDAGSAVVDETVALIASADPAAITASQRAMAARPDSTPWLPSIDKPTLVLVGSEDALTPPDVMRPIAEAISGARYVEVPGAGHMAPVEDPAAVNAALREFFAAL